MQDHNQKKNINPTRRKTLAGIFVFCACLPHPSLYIKHFHNNFAKTQTSFASHFCGGAHQKLSSKIELLNLGEPSWHA